MLPAEQVGWGTFASSCEEVDAALLACLGCNRSSSVALIDWLPDHGRTFGRRCSTTRTFAFKLRHGAGAPAGAASSDATAGRLAGPAGFIWAADHSVRFNKMRRLFELLLLHLPGAHWLVKIDTDVYLNLLQLRALLGSYWQASAPPRSL